MESAKVIPKCSICDRETNIAFFVFPMFPINSISSAPPQVSRLVVSWHHVEQEVLFPGRYLQGWHRGDDCGWNKGQNKSAQRGWKAFVDVWARLGPRIKAAVCNEALSSLIFLTHTALKTCTLWTLSNRRWDKHFCSKIKILFSFYF